MLEHAALVDAINTRESMTIDVFGSLSNICDRPSYVIFKEIVDIMFASFAILFLLPLFPLICLMVKLDSPGPVFYSQSRVGKQGRIFRMYKFRTMYADAEKYTGPVWSSKDDPRITRVGKWLRKIYIDELPQCINIILGDMSLVGPRPERPEFMRLFEELVPGFSRRNAVKPGITGLAQVSCFYKMVSSDIRKKLKYDLFYIRKHCCVMDIRIIVKTVKFWLNSCIG